MFPSLLLFALLAAGTAVPRQPTSSSEIVIPSNSFDSYDDLEAYWNYLYPWGSDHNGCASSFLS